MHDNKLLLSGKIYLVAKLSGVVHTCLKTEVPLSVDFGQQIGCQWNKEMLT